MKEDLSRFLKAQETDYPVALEKIRNGQKESHWMWYVFPQLKGLGFSSMSSYYGIRDLEEAKAYLAHPVLGNRMREISDALLALETNNPEEVMGHIDRLKLRSSMTLFAEADVSNPLFQMILEKFFRGKKDLRTLELLEKN